MKQSSIPTFNEEEEKEKEEEGMKEEVGMVRKEVKP